jgi:pyridoxal 5'-phosphate synthase pdxT subunit
MKVGVLALQGDVPEHRAAIVRVLPEGSVVDVEGPSDLERVSGLLMPGGESTTLAKLLRGAGLFHPLKRRISEGLPVLATCAGLILLARSIAPSPGGRDPETLEFLDVVVRRNDYGRQAESFEAPVRIPSIPGPEFPGVFIRSPRILEVGPKAEAFAFRGEEVVGARSGTVWGLAFHPELSEDPRLHAAWVASFASQTPTKRRTNTKATRPAPTSAANQ